MNENWETLIKTDYRGKYIKCLRCAHETTLFGSARLVVFICPMCQCAYSKSTSDFTKLKKAKKVFDSASIPLYTKFNYEAIAYTIIGCMLKREKGDYSAKWEEYTLIDDLGNYVYLSQSDGHWMLLRPRLRPSAFLDERAEKSFCSDDGLDYHFYTKYLQFPIEGAGEFTHEVLNVKLRYVEEYICPPRIFTYEEYKTEKEYFQGQYIYPSTIKRALSEKIELPVRSGVGSIQPFYFGIQPALFLKLSIFIALLSTLFLIIISPQKSEVPLAKSSVSLLDTINKGKVVSNSFELKSQSYHSLVFHSYSNVINDWIEGNFTLVNETTGKEIFFELGLEYYEGYEDGIHWTEGEVSREDYIGGLESGTYHFEMDVMGQNSSKAKFYTFTVFKDNPYNWNHWMLILMYLGFSLLIYFWGKNFEAKR